MAIAEACRLLYAAQFARVLLEDDFFMNFGKCVVLRAKENSRLPEYLTDRLRGAQFGCGIVGRTIRASAAVP